jgi:branched-chain amino acid transport system ATP-binding protein
MIEHDIDLISRLCDPVIVLTNGELLTQGPPEKIKSDPEVIDAYLGRKNREGESE